MASQPDTANRETAAALAMLLANAGRRYDLPSLIRQAKVRPRQFRPIRPTNALASNMAAPHFAIVKAWADALPDILAAVPFGRAAVAQAIEQAASRIGFTVMQAKAQFPRAVDAVERFHRQAWISRVKASTGLDVGMLTQPSDVADATSATTSWNGQLAQDIHSQIQTKLTAFMLLAGITQADAKAKAADVIAKARVRTSNIGTDQVRKLSRAMDDDRRQAAGIDQWTWRHLDPQPHPRVEHQRRAGQVYSAANPPATMPGEEPFCHCWGEPKLL